MLNSANANESGSDLPASHFTRQESERLDATFRGTPETHRPEIEGIGRRSSVLSMSSFPMNVLSGLSSKSSCPSEACTRR